MTNQTVDINENLVKIDNLLKGLEFLYEEISTRKAELIKSVNVDVKEIVKEEIKSDYFMSDVSYYIRNHHGDGIAREVSYIIMDKIDSDIDAFINQRVNRALEQAGVEVKPQETSSSVPLLW
jgi:hypothetical protein